MTANATVAEIVACQWARINGRLLCEAHGLLGQRVGLGKLYRVATAEGTQLVRAPDPATAQAAVHGSSVERAAPHEGDDAPVLDTRPLGHIARTGRRTGQRAGRPWVEAKPVQFAETSGEARPTRPTWELDDASPTIDLVTGRSGPVGDDPTAGQPAGGAGPPMQRAGRTVKVGKNTLCIGPDGRVIAGQQQEGDEPPAPGRAPCRWDALGPRHLVCLAHHRIIAAPARLSAWERSLARVQQLVTTTFGRPRAR